MDMKHQFKELQGQFRELMVTLETEALEKSESLAARAASPPKTTSTPGTMILTTPSGGGGFKLESAPTVEEEISLPLSCLSSENENEADFLLEDVKPNTNLGRKQVRLEQHTTPARGLPSVVTGAHARVPLTSTVNRGVATPARATRDEGRNRRTRDRSDNERPARHRHRIPGEQHTRQSQGTRRAPTRRRRDDSSESDESDPDFSSEGEGNSDTDSGDSSDDYERHRQRSRSPQRHKMPTYSGKERSEPFALKFTRII
ncbi:uncharacterized protein LOC110460143 [Mizuhopecten yessoensis]|uniref:uncharacterized protein LOC110460143 n=1 Tax=Mizuhopecten yessoensis TaxID=6573 RepID=UPI000B45DB7D|nr:uncharacterized protein LOC110460143 [Mizuhopecten yessoensis]